MVRGKFILGVMITLLISAILVSSAVYAMFEVPGQAQFNCAFKDLVTAVNKTMAAMGLTIKTSTVNEESMYAYYVLEESLHSSGEWPTYYKVEVVKENHVFLLKVVTGTHGFSYSGKSNNKQMLKTFMDNVKKYVEQPELDDLTPRCPTCKQPIGPDVTQCSNCHSYLGALEKPGDVQIFCEQPGEVKLSWKDENSNEEGFYIERKTGDGEYVRIANVSGNTEYYKDQNISTGNTYTYRIIAFNSECISVDSSEVKIFIR